jgi:hypothetical protein
MLFHNSIVILFLFLLPFTLASLAPILFRVSKFAAPNETVLINGVNLVTASVSLCPLRGSPSCLDIPLASNSWDGGLKVTLPNPPKAWSVRACISDICSDDSQVQRFTINAPRIAWALGDGGGEGTSTGQASVALGGILRVFGAALAINSQGFCPPLQADDHGSQPATLPIGTSTILFLCINSTNCITLPSPLIASCHRLDVLVPVGISPGSYDLIVDNSLATSSDGLGILEKPFRVNVFQRDPWPSTPQWTVGKDCVTIDGCLQSASVAGGGVVNIPPGIFNIPQDMFLTLPPHTSLLGSGMSLSTLQWISNSPTGALAPAISCPGLARMANFSILITSPIGIGIHFNGGSGCELQGVNVTIDVPLDLPPIGAPFAVDGASSWRATDSSFLQRGNCTKSWPHNTVYTVWGSRDGLFANNILTCYCQGHSTDSSQRIVFDNNTVIALGSLGSQGSGFSTFESPQVLEHIYEGRRIDIGNPFSVKHYESMTFDGPGGAYLGTFSSTTTNGTDGTRQSVVLSIPGRAPGDWPDGRNVSSYIGASVSVVYGPGLGSTARVVDIVPDNSSWTTASLWVFDPPLIGAIVNESYLSINPFRGSFIFEGSAYVNDTTFQLWAQATDIIVAGCSFFNISGDVRNWPLQYQCPWLDGFPCAWQVNIDTHFVNNVIECSHGGLNAVSSDYGAVPPVDVTIGISNTRRGNILRGGNVGATGRFADLLVEHTLFQTSDACNLPAGSVNINTSIPGVLIR